jgi:tryptophanyl-tRNA synthetase
MFGQTFPEPQRFKTAGDYVPSLAGTGKMSKSINGSFINLTDNIGTIKKKLAGAPTDSGIVGGELPKTGGIANLFILLKLFKLENEYIKFEQAYKAKKIRYSDLKEVLVRAIFKELQPFQKRRREFENNPTLIDSIIEEGQIKCSKMAEETMKEVREKMGL